METPTSTPPTVPNDPLDILEKVIGRLGEPRLKALAAQPLCIASGGMDAVLKAACAECAGYPQPEIAAAVRVLQLCGSTAKPEDLV